MEDISDTINKRYKVKAFI